MIKRSIFFAVIILWLGCADEDLRDKDYPLIETLSVDNIRPDGVTYHANLFNSDEVQVEEYGFIWIQSSPLPGNSGSKIVGTNQKIRSFSLEVRSGLAPSAFYIVVAYAVSKGKTYYGEQVPFETL